MYSNFRRAKIKPFLSATLIRTTISKTKQTATTDKTSHLLTAAATLTLYW